MLFRICAVGRYLPNSRISIIPMNWVGKRVEDDGGVRAEEVGTAPLAPPRRQEARHDAYHDGHERSREHERDRVPELRGAGVAVTGTESTNERPMLAWNRS